MFQHVWEQYPDKKWFIKADDDTYLHLDNILDMLSEYDHQEPHYIGRAGEYGRGKRTQKCLINSAQAMRTYDTVAGGQDIYSVKKL
jgi:hypothetical protein